MTSTNNKLDPNAKLGWLERISYGLGDYAGNLVYSAISAFLLVYYTEVCKMNPGVAASVMGASRIFDGISDLIMGRVIDNTHTKKGKARPWILRASIPLAICFILMIAFFLINLMTYAFCQERVADESEKDKEEGKKQPSVLIVLKSLVVNKYWVINVIFLFTQFLLMSTFFGSNYYFSQYVLSDSKSYSILSNALSLSQMAIMFVTPVIMRKVSKRNVGLLGMVLSTVGFLLTAVAGKNVGFVMVSNIIKGIGFGCGAAVMWGLLQDAITYGQWLTGVQAVGMGNSASSFTMKIGSGLGTASLGWILAAGHFQEDPTGAAAINAINVAVIWVPTVVCIIGIVCVVLLGSLGDVPLPTTSEGASFALRGKVHLAGLTQARYPL